MPGPFTHIYTARRVSDYLKSNGFVRLQEGPLQVQQTLDPQILKQFSGDDPTFWWTIMQTWEKYTALGAVGPDLFFFLQDYAVDGIPCDAIMLALSALYIVDDSSRDDWEPLLSILEPFNGTWVAIERFLIKLDKIWQKFLDVWNRTVGKVINAAGQVIDDMTGGMLSALGDAIKEFANDLIALLVETLITQGDVFSWFSLKMRKGFDEQAFLWSDMLHYRHTSKMVANLINEARKLLVSGDPNPQTNLQYQQFMAYALGWMCHVGTDVVAHSFVNEQCGGPFRTHWQRHHLVENHIDGWNYHETSGSNSALPADTFCAYTPFFPSLNQSALYFAVQLTPNSPNGHQRPSTLPPDDADPGHQADRKKALDTDGEMPEWLAEGIVRALIATYGSDADTERSQILMGSKFETYVRDDPVLIAQLASFLANDPHVSQIAHSVTELLNLIFTGSISSPDTPPPKIDVPQGFPTPWEIKATYRFMLTFFKQSYMDSLKLKKPKAPAVYTPPPSDFQYPGPPDFNGPGSSDDPIQSFSNWIMALLNWIAKVLSKAAQAAYDIGKMVASGATFPVRELIYQTVTLPAWTTVEGVREILCHLGFLMPQDLELYEDGEIAKPSEIDTELIKLGHSADSAFLGALAANMDPLANLDVDPSLVNQGVRNPRDEMYPWLPVRDPKSKTPPGDPVEYERPWAFPDLNNDKSRNRVESLRTTSGPYPQGEMPNVLLRADGPGNNQERLEYQNAETPDATDMLNNSLIGHHPMDLDRPVNPLGDPIAFSSYLIGQVLANPKWQAPTDPNVSNGFQGADFNLDADRGYGYLCWDWDRYTDAAHIRRETTTFDGRVLSFQTPCEVPEGAPDWRYQINPSMRLHYKKAGNVGCGQQPPAPPVRPKGAEPTRIGKAPPQRKRR